MATETTDRVAAKLDWLRTILPAVAASPESFDMEEVAGDFGRILAVAEAVTAFHQPGPYALLGALCPEHEACRNFSITSSEADRVAACPKCSATVQRTCSHGAHAIWPCAEYRAISGELLSKEGSDGRD